MKSASFSETSTPDPNLNAMQNKSLIHQAEDQLKLFGKFVDLYDKKLQSLTLAENNNFVKCNNAAPPTSLHYSGTYENLPLPRLIESDNKLLNKVLLTFSHLCQECQTLEAECSQTLMKFLFQDEELCAFREGNADDGRSTEKCFVKMSESMEFLYEIKLLTQHCILVANNILHQCGAFLTHNKLPFVIHFPEVFQNLSRILVQMVRFDEALSRSNYQKCWSGYKKTISSVSGNMNKFPKYSEGEINGLLNVLNELDFLFTGNVFQVSLALKLYVWFSSSIYKNSASLCGFIPFWWDRGWVIGMAVLPNVWIQGLITFDVAVKSCTIRN